MPKNFRVSVVDDDESMRESISSLLRSVGINADTFASAEEFLSAKFETDPSCLILDLSMPGMSGLELQQRLARDGRKIPIIFVTAHASTAEVRTRALQSGAVDFLQKPFNEDVLLNHVYAVLSHAR